MLPITLQSTADYQGLDQQALLALIKAQLAQPLERSNGEPVPLTLLADHNGLSIGAADDSNTAPTRVDFLDKSLHYRLHTSGKRQGLGKALGLDKLSGGRELLVLDATAGLGRDALLMAHMGCRVLMLEQSPLMHALLQDGFTRARKAAPPEFMPVLARLQLQHQDARAWLAAAARGEAETPDVVYLDPMFPPRSKSAKVKKDIALLHQLLGSEQDLASLVSLARQVARYRVVLKRPDGKLPPEVPEPTLWIGDKPAAFAVYINRSIKLPKAEEGL